MESLLEVLGTGSAGLIAWFTKRLVDNIDNRIKKLEGKIASAERSNRRDLNLYLEAVKELKSYNENVQRDLVDKVLRHAKMISSDVDKIKTREEKSFKRMSDIYGKVIHIEGKSSDNQNSIAIQKKKIDSLMKKLSEK